MCMSCNPAAAECGGGAAAMAASLWSFRLEHHEKAFVPEHHIRENNVTQSKMVLQFKNQKWTV